MIIDPSGRGPTMRQLFIAGIALILVAALALWLLMLRYTGHFESNVKVTADLTTTGDGLPSKADVKFRGALVGAVDSVTVAAEGEQQHVKINLKPDFASGIPSTVTARVVPSNIFAVTSVELLDNGPSPEHLHEGSVIHEDKSKPTIALQTTLTTLRSVLDRIDPEKLGRVLGSLADALDPSVRVPGSTIERLDRWITAVRGAIPDLGTFLGNFSSAAAGLDQSAPELVTVLGKSVTTAHTIAEKRSQLVSLLTGGAGTIDTVNNLFARNPNSGKELVNGLDQTFGALASDPAAIPASFVNLQNSLTKLNTTFHWGPGKLMSWNIDATLTPFKQYNASDCPHYGDLYGPRCGSVPANVPAPPVPPELVPRRLDSAGPAPAPVSAPVPGVQIPGLPSIPGVPGLAGPAATPAAPA